MRCPFFLSVCNCLGVTPISESWRRPMTPCCFVAIWWIDRKFTLRCGYIVLCFGDHPWWNWWRVIPEIGYNSPPVQPSMRSQATIQTAVGKFMEFRQRQMTRHTLRFFPWVHTSGTARILSRPAISAHLQSLVLHRWCSGKKRRFLWSARHQSGSSFHTRCTDSE